MIINLKIEIIKIFLLEFNLTSDKKKKDEDSVEKEPATEPATTE